MSVLPVCVCVHHAYAWKSLGSQKRTLNPLEMELVYLLKPLCGCWELNPGIQQDQLVLLASLHPTD